MEAKTAQLRINPKAIIAEGCGGTIFWATPTRARLLIDCGAVVLLNAPRPGPSEASVVGPTETKPAGPSEAKESPGKKSSVDAPVGPSTDSASSNKPGSASDASSSAADHRSPLTNADLSKRRGRSRKAPLVEIGKRKGS